MIVLGALLVAGLPLAIAPLGTARVANAVRFVPYGKSPKDVRFFRLSGIVAIVAGLVVVGLAV